MLLRSDHARRRVKHDEADALPLRGADEAPHLVVLGRVDALRDLGRVEEQRHHAQVRLDRVVLEEVGDEAPERHGFAGHHEDERTRPPPPARRGERVVHLDDRLVVREPACHIRLRVLNRYAQLLRPALVPHADRALGPGPDGVPGAVAVVKVQLAAEATRPLPKLIQQPLKGLRQRGHEMRLLPEN